MFVTFAGFGFGSRFFVFLFMFVWGGVVIVGFVVVGVIFGCPTCPNFNFCFVFC